MPPWVRLLGWSFAVWWRGFAIIGIAAIHRTMSLFAAGLIMSAFAGAVDAGVAVGVGGALIDLGTPESEANRFGGRILMGGIFRTVHFIETFRSAQGVVKFGALGLYF